MSNETTIVFGVPVSSLDPFFLAVVRFHILVGVICVVAGIAAMLSQKRRGRHSTFGTIYYWCLSVVAASATGWRMPVSLLASIKLNKPVWLPVSEPSCTIPVRSTARELI